MDLAVRSFAKSLADAGFRWKINCGDYPENEETPSIAALTS